MAVSGDGPVPAVAGVLEAPPNACSTPSVPSRHGMIRGDAFPTEAILASARPTLAAMRERLKPGRRPVPEYLARAFDRVLRLMEAFLDT